MADSNCGMLVKCCSSCHCQWQPASECAQLLTSTQAVDFHGFVSFLRSTLDLSNNVMEGRLPGFLSRLTRLQRLFLDNNHFSGELRVVYSRLERLVYVCSSLTRNAPWHALRIEVFPQHDAM